MRGKVRASFDGGGTRGKGTTQHWERFEHRGKNRSAYEGNVARGNRSRKPDIWGYDRQVYNQATVFFFTNFPEDWSHESMWRTFHKYGRVLDIYSPMRKSTMGSRFGFVRYLDVRNEWELELQLDQIRVGEYKIWVNRPRFTENESHKRANAGHVELGKAGVQRTYAEAVKGNLEIRSETEKGKQAKGEKEYRHMRITKTNNIPAQAWRAKDKIIPTLQEKFFMEGYFSCKVRAMGGRLVLLEGGDKEEIKDLVEIAPEWLGQWFIEIKPWNSAMVAQERFVWLRCQGVPVHAWGPKVFATIGSVWGKFLTLDDSTSRKLRFDIGRMLISTPVMDFISKSISIGVNGEPYTIKVMEEEATNGIFSMKSDHVLKDMSGSDDASSESWSLDKESEDEVGEAYLDGGDAESSRNKINKSKDDAEDVEAREEASQVAKTREEHSSYRWKHERQNSKGDHFPTVNDSPANADDSRGNLQANRDDKIQDFCNNNHEGSTYDVELVPGSLNTQRFQKMESHRKNETTRPLKLTSPAEVDESWANIASRPTKQATNGMGDRTSSREIRNENAMSNGSAQLGNENAIKGSSFRNIREAERDRAASTNLHDDEQESTFWKGFESESGNEQEWMGRRQRKPKRSKKKKIRSCISVYKEEGKEKQEIKPDKRKRASKEQGSKEKMPIFSPGSQNQVAGDSIIDSGIEIRNGSLRRDLELCTAERIWAFAKEIGVGVRDNETEVIQRLKEMEDRDRRLIKSTKSGVRDLVVKEKVEFLAIQESKLEMVDYQVCRTIWGADNFDWVAKASRGTSGRLICIWNSDLLKKESIIEELMSEVGGCWCLMGDFNAIRNVQEWNGGRSNRRDMVEFDEFIRECGLIDLPLIGRKYTWYQPNGAVMSRLDRFLLSEDWCLKWGDIKQWGLRRTKSDHCPILMKNLSIDWGPKPFRFFDVWLDLPGCIDLVREVWSATTTSGWHGYKLKEKLKETKKALKVWSRNMASETDSIIKKCEDSIAAIDLKGEVTSLTEDDIQTRRDSFLELWKQQRIKEGMWRQKARKAWIKDGDANTKFFHRCVNEIKEGVANYFENLFAEERWQRPHLDGIEFKKISAEDNSLLLAPFNEEEVKRAVWSCEGSKAPGPDGFNFNLIRQIWDVIKGDMMGFVDEFHKNGRLVRGSNCSFIVLLPKVTNPQKIEEFRPISLIGVMYKVIAKLLANRISSVLDNIIGECQMAFIKGRQIVDNIVIANETIDAAKRNKIASFVLKVDFEKAYDKVCWKFLDYMMSRMGFDSKWRRWISECLKTAETSILLNGSATRQVKINRGLRQGDPLSPYLFLLVAEGLNGIISSAINHGLFEGINIGNRGMIISHLQFADDSILFGKAMEGNIWAAKSIMRIFELASGLKINIQKSQLLGMNVSEESLLCGSP
ncbi:hypothetical protein SLEP1_g30130 [Rubroshorea leprosula]|uniref:Reverse transcriptase domain-containing protein n=1 Tax=Rubroshorea leprosula TaxID=152421 RepID=A0AAV5K7P7_9ROSI|nr:hypothetical protein SLEP1_g30130 [Rubroshorea leprosula]